MSETKKANKAKKRTAKRIRTTPAPGRPPLSRKFSLADLRARFPQTAQNRYVLEKSEDPVTVVLDGGSSVTKGRDAVLVVEDGGRIGTFRVELRSSR